MIEKQMWKVDKKKHVDEQIFKGWENKLFNYWKK